MSKKLIEEYDLMLAGTQFSNKYDNAEGSRKGSKFDLEIEADNPVDPLAVNANFNGKNIGYIPRDENLEISYYLSHPEWFLIDCRQKKKIDDEKTSEMIVVLIYIYAISENHIPFSFEIFDKEFPTYDKDVENRKSKIEFEKKQVEQNKVDFKREFDEQNKIKKKEDNKDAWKGCLMFIVIFIFIYFLAKSCN